LVLDVSFESSDSRSSVGFPPKTVLPVHGSFVLLQHSKQPFVLVVAEFEMFGHSCVPPPSPLAGGGFETPENESPYQTIVARRLKSLVPLSFYPSVDSSASVERKSRAFAGFQQQVFEVIQGSAAEFDCFGFGSWHYR
jgi:hypothetical protein